MGRGGKVVGQRNFKKRVRSNDEGSDDSDEDYVIENEEHGSGDESVEYASSGEEYCSSEEDEEEQGRRKKVSRKVVGSNIRRKRSSLGRKRGKASYEEEDEDYVKVEDDENVRANKRSRSKSCLENGKSGANSSRKRRVVSYEEDNDYVDFEDDDYDDEDDDKDDEDYVKVRASKRSKGCLGNGAPVSRKMRKKGLYEEDDDEDYVKVEDDENGDDDDGVSVQANKTSRSKSYLENGKWGANSSRKRRMVSYEEDEDNEDYVDGIDEEEDDHDDDVKVRFDTRRRNNGFLENGKTGGKTSRKRKGSGEEDEDEDYVNVEDGEEEEEDDDDYDGEDEELALCEEEEDDCLDEEEEEEEEVVVAKMAKRKKTSKKRGARTNSRVVKKSAAKKGRLRKKVKYEEEEEEEDDDDFVDCNLSAREKSKKMSGSSRRRKYTVNSDSDFVASEEEREQVKPPVARKGKEKVKEWEPEAAAKQVCGICFTEEDKRRLRGTLNCCSHYFCFKCIMEWSKVESRCPLCKQRFTTITKNGRLSGMDMRSVVIEVPKRDQVYQPTEEEIRSFIDPYEHVRCTECHQGGDDAHMLLCDLCDSPAHTYCVGLGQQVPPGNWYCDGCRPAGSSSSQNQPDNIPSDQRPMLVSNRLIGQTPPPPTVSSLEDRSHPISQPSTFPQAFGSPTMSQGLRMGDSSTSGTGAQTLWSRREIQRRIQNLLSSRMNMTAGGDDGVQAATNIQRIQSLLSSRMNSMAGGMGGIRAPTSVYSGFPGARIAQHGEMPARNSVPSSLIGNNREFLGFRANQWRPAQQQGASTVAAAIERPVNLTLWPENSGINPVPGNLYSNRPTTNRLGFDFAPYGVDNNNNQLYILKEQLQSMITAHLKALSLGIELGQETMNGIVRTSTNIVMAYCGLEHERDEVRPLPSVPSRCSHVDRIASGQTSIMRGFCSSCFESIVSDVVKNILDSRVPTRLPQWLSLGL